MKFLIQESNLFLFLGVFREDPRYHFVIWMESIEEDQKNVTVERKQKKLVKGCTYVACLCSFLVSMLGGLILVWWEFEYHPTNSQQWMVPFGLILFGTPVIVWFSVLLSDICNSGVHISTSNPSVYAVDSSVDDPER